MKIGIFDSGLGGLIIARAIVKKMPDYDYIYLGDAKNLPYGNKSQSQIYKNSVKAVEYLFKKDCAIIIVACNTISTQALRKIQQEWLPKSKWKERRVLGVIRPTAEMVGKFTNIGLIGTIRTVDSGTYKKELENVNQQIVLHAYATPKLVPMIEDDTYDEKVLQKYLSRFTNIDALILGCTHYGLLKKEIKKILGKKVKVVAQEDFIPQKLSSYLGKHKEIKMKLSRDRGVKLLVTKISPRYKELTRKWFGKNAKPELTKID